jgi:hypothetical protein
LHPLAHVLMMFRFRVFLSAGFTQLFRPVPCFRELPVTIHFLFAQHR